MTDENAMKQVALRLAAHLKERGHPVPFEVLTHVLAALRGFTNWHVFLKRKASSAPAVQLTQDIAYYQEVLRAARDALKGNSPGVALTPEQRQTLLAIEDALTALKAQEPLAPAAMPARKDLWEARGQAADAAYGNYQFGEGVSVEDDDGWEWLSPGSEISRTVYVRTDEGDDVGSSAKLTFHVRFAPDTDQVLEAYARDEKGSDWGSPGAKVAPGPSVYVAYYDYEHGNTVRVFASEAAALAWRTQIAADYWDDQFGEVESFGPKPDARTIGEEYFRLMQENDGYVEIFNVVQAPVEG